MMKDNNSDFSNIINTAHSSFRVSKKGEERIFNRIAELTEKKRKKVNPLLFFRYVPSLSVIVLIACLLPIVIFSSYTILIPGTVSAHPLVLVSDSGVRGKDGVLYTSGYRFKQNDRIVVTENTPCDLALENLADLRFFPGSEAELTKYSEFSGRITVTLDKGSLYINKDNKRKSNKELVVRADKFGFTLLGTRVLIELQEETVKAICYNGHVLVSRQDIQDKRSIMTLFPGEKVELSLTEGPRRFLVDKLSLKEKQIDDKNKIFLPYEHIPEEKDESGIESEEKDLIQQPGDKENPDKVIAVTPEKTRAMDPTPVTEEPEKHLFSSSVKLAELAGTGVQNTAQSNMIHFYAWCHDKNSAFIITKTSLFRMQNGKVEEPTTFSFPVTFKVKPLLYKNTLILPEAHNLFLINKETGEIQYTIPFKEKEVLEDNYYPLVREGLLYLPVKNSGYYTLDINQPDKGLSLFYTEEFPLTPLFGDNFLIIGAFYENYIASVDENKNIRWRIDLAGESFCNIIGIDDKIYTYLFENNTHKIIEITKAGTRTNEWTIKDRIISDIFPFMHSIIGMDTGGTLFLLDIRSSKIIELATTINIPLSARSWRNYYPLISNGFLYTGTSDGSLVMYNLNRKLLEKELVINSSESFYTSPFIMGDVLYIISNSGSLYQVF